MKKIILLIIAEIFYINIFTTNVSAYIDNMSYIRAGILLYTEDTYVSLIKNNFLKIEEENKDIVDFIFYNAENNQELQNKQLDELIDMKVDLIILNVVDANEYGILIHKIKQANIPVVFMGREPKSLDIIETYDKAIYIGSETCVSGNIQGEMIINELRNESLVDRNKNNILEYILLQGVINDVTTTLRSECVIKTLNEHEIKTKEIASEYCNWNRECAKERVKYLFEKNKDNIDVIISNNDEMAIGAILALQELGYNKGDPKKYIAVVGIDATDPAVKLIREGVMTGTVIQDHEAVVKAVYRIGMNLVKENPPLQGTEYKLDKAGVAVMIPYNGYITRKSPNL